MSRPESIEVTIEETGHEHERRYRFNFTLVEETLIYKHADETFHAPLAGKIFGFPWAEAVKIEEDSVIVEKQDWVEWDVLAEPLGGLLREHFELNLPITVDPSPAQTGENTSFEVSFEPTPNPDAMKFMVSAPITDSSHDYTSQEEAEESPLAQKIFELPWVAGVFVGPQFITVRKQEWVEWEPLCAPLAQLIKEQLEQGVKAAPIEGDTAINEDDSPTVRTIKTILNNEIRPAVARDGGDIVFNRYENGQLFLHMKGACAGCPSSTATLKMGIEARLKEEIKDLQDVISV